MAKIIYGVDADKELVPVDVRNALVNCFKKAHCDILDETFGSAGLSPEEAETLAKMDIEMLIKEFFRKTGGDYEHPTKESILAVMSKLREFATQFRAEDTVKKHYVEMMALVDNLL